MIAMIRTGLSIGANFSVGHLAAVHVTKYLPVWFTLNPAVSACRRVDVCVIEDNLKTTSNRNVNMSIIFYSSWHNKVDLIICKKLFNQIN